MSRAVRFDDKNHWAQKDADARENARIFIDELQRNGVLDTHQ
jgi:hypothetical protein